MTSEWHACKKYKTVLNNSRARVWTTQCQDHRIDTSSVPERWDSTCTIPNTLVKRKDFFKPFSCSRNAYFGGQKGGARAGKGFPGTLVWPGGLRCVMCSFTARKGRTFLSLTALAEAR